MTDGRTEALTIPPLLKGGDKDNLECGLLQFGLAPLRNIYFFYIQNVDLT